MPEWTSETAVNASAALAELDLLKENFADLARAHDQLAADELGWASLSGQWTGDSDFTPEQRKRTAKLARIMAIANPLVKNGVAVRTGFVWGQGVEIAVKDDPDSGQDVNAVVQAFLDDPDVQEVWSGMQAREEHERALGTDGELFWCLPTDQRTGQVQIREIDPDEIVDIVEDPSNWRRPLYYKRQFVDAPRSTETGERTAGRSVTVYYPALGYQPAGALRYKRIGGSEVRWDQPVLHVAVNRPRKSLRGIGDAVPALPWATLSKQFLENWATLMKALSRYAWKQTAKGGRVEQAAAKHRTAEGVGGTVVMPMGADLQAVPKSGATIDADSGLPLIKMVAAAFGIPITMLLGDPGSTGARAVAETLDRPTENSLSMRREMWAASIRKVLNHVIDSAVIAPGGALHGTVERVGDRMIVNLPEDDTRTISFDWPDFSTDSVLDQMKAVTMLDQTGKIDSLTIARLVLKAMKVKDADEIIAGLRDEDGNYVPPDETEAALAQRRRDRGEAA